MKNKFNWGTGILASFAVFLIIMAVMAVISFNNPSELTTGNYYDQGIKYQQVIDMKENTARLMTKPLIEKSNNNFIIQFPKDINFNNAVGKVKFYYPADSEKDFDLLLNLDENGSMVIPVEQSLHGPCKIQLKWTLDNISYFDEQTYKF